ncbi:MAG: FCD domain-containing protein [Pseudomonadota bacterium]
MAVERTDSETSLTVQVWRRLRGDILAGALAPASKLKVSDLSARYDAGASPIREALSQLAAERLVEKLDNRGFRVAPASTEEFTDIVKARCWLEAAALRDSLANADETWEDALIVAFHRLDRAERSHSTWETHHRRFHGALLAACTSTTTLAYCGELYDRAIRYRRIARTNARSARDVAREHQAIFEAAVAREADRAVTLLLEHYRTTSSTLVL